MPNFLSNDWLQLAITTLVIIGIYLLTKSIIDRFTRGKMDSTLIRSLILFTIALVGFIAIILMIPMEESLRGQVTSLLGIVLSAVFALSSATLIGNGLAGLMLRAINNFKMGDYIEVGEHFGRITERGLFHTEIQTHHRDLTTLPNLYLSTNPVKVVRRSGTFVMSEVSLGYDVPRQQVEPLLLEAATAAGFTDPYVTIPTLGDFSIVYQVHAHLLDTTTLITGKSRLNASVLDQLHSAGIEIMSPTFMGQRRVDDVVMIPPETPKTTRPEAPSNPQPESLIFDKAKEADSIEKGKQNIADIDAEIALLEERRKEAVAPEDKSAILEKIDTLKTLKTTLRSKLAEKVEELEDTD